MKQVFEAVDNLNSRPRKCRGFKTPYEAFEELTGVNIKKMLIQVAPNSLEGTESSSTTHRMPWCYVKHMAKPADPAARVHRNGDFGLLFATIPFADPAGFGFCATLAWQVTRRAAKQEIRSYLDRHLSKI